MDQRTHIRTLQADILARLMTTPAELLLLLFDAGVHIGMGTPRARHPDPTVEALISAVVDRWYAESDAIHAWRPEALPLPFDDAPAWLRAHAERKVLEVRHD